MPCDSLPATVKTKEGILFIQNVPYHAVWEKQKQPDLDLWDTYTWQPDAAQLPHPHTERRMGRAVI